MPERVLVVDDDVAIRHLLRACLAREGYEIEEAEDGVVALDRLRARNYSAVLLDLMMPRLNGWEVLAALRADDPSRLSCIIVLSAALPKRDLDSVDRALVFAVIPKPFDLHQLQRTIAACVEQNAVGDATT